MQFLVHSRDMPFLFSVGHHEMLPQVSLFFRTSWFLSSPPLISSFIKILQGLPPSVASLCFVPSPFEKVIPLVGSGSTCLCSHFMSREYLKKNSPVFLLGRLGNVSSFKCDLQLVVEKQNTTDNEMLLKAVFQLSRELVFNLK